MSGDAPAGHALQQLARRADGAAGGGAGFADLLLALLLLHTNEIDLILSRRALLGAELAAVHHARQARELPRLLARLLPVADLQLKQPERRIALLIQRVVDRLLRAQLLGQLAAVRFGGAVPLLLDLRLEPQPLDGIDSARQLALQLYATLGRSITSALAGRWRRAGRRRSG